MSSFQCVTLIATFTHFWKWTELKHKPFCCTSSVSSTYWRSNIPLTALFAVSPSNSCTGAKPWSVITTTLWNDEYQEHFWFLYCYAMTFCASRWERDHLGSLLWWLKPGSPCSHKHIPIQPSSCSSEQYSNAGKSLLPTLASAHCRLVAETWFHSSGLLSWP